MTNNRDAALRADSYDSWQSISNDMESMKRLPQSQQPPLSYWAGRVSALAALLTQPADSGCVMVPSEPEVLARGWFHALPEENDYEVHDIEACPEQPCPECVPMLIIRDPAAAPKEQKP